MKIPEVVCCPTDRIRRCGDSAPPNRRDTNHARGLPNPVHGDQSLGLAGHRAERQIDRVSALSEGLEHPVEVPQEPRIVHDKEDPYGRRWLHHGTA